MSSIPARTRIRKSPVERREEISAAAIALALEQGLLAVTLRGIAARVDVASGLVAHYAPSMDDLVAATFSAIVRAELDDVRALLADGPDAIHRVGMLVDTLLDGSRDDVTLVWVQAWALGPRSDALAAAVREEMDAWQELIAGIVAEGIAQDAFHVADPDAVAWQILAMIDGLNAQSLVHWHDAPDRRDLTRRSIAALLA
ncbi:MAG: TetR family transcriptional regulator C-terminal domain-containing protein [Microbacterium sp.]|uniref:TetR/AcrR family transcriptional regulator n=1 Tax=Microbacterium sp. TaxID=51671 RepID=UPI001AD21E2F|nr:TetR family transcriptional regulator C-terminal domain-containing protein [Microbacterium sp.]MBN9155129.1 TetR family transcriptional regulator C-terminal domain-containing protein [Microbacterium sp.]MBN9172291.1 TetR family transcriptional regulator C-terminal domain-containing protein [Microbacterium sp.]